MAQSREEIVRTSVDPDLGVVEERTVQTDGLGSRVVRTTTTEQAPSVPAVHSTHVVRRFWRRTPLAASTSEYASAPSYNALDPGLAQFLRLSWFALGLLESLLGLRFVLSLLGANEHNDFAAMVYALTWTPVGPFRTLFATPTAGASTFELFTLIAMVVYFIGWWVVVRTVGLVLNRSVDV
jgi:hypothetical protein